MTLCYEEAMPETLPIHLVIERAVVGGKGSACQAFLEARRRLSMRWFIAHNGRLRFNFFVH